MTRETRWAVSAGVALCLTAAACVTTSTPAPKSAPPEAAATPSLALAPKEEREKWVVDGSGGASAAGVMLGSRLLAAFPALKSGRIAVAGDPNVPLGIESGIAEGIGGGCVLASGLGLKGSAREIVSQLDPSTFRALVWLETPNRNTGEFNLQLWDAEGGRHSSTLLVKFDPALQDESRVKSALTWLAFSRPVCGLAWQPGAKGGLWVRRGGELVRIEMETRGEAASVPATGIPDGACLLRWEDDGGGSLGCFGASASGGGWLVHVSNGQTPPPDPIQEFPLPEKAKRFLSAPFQSGTGYFMLETTAGEELGAFTDLVWLQGDSGTAFVALGTDGTVWAVRGDLLSVMVGPHAGPCTAIAAYGGNLYLAEARPPYRVKSFRMQADHSWLESADPVAMPAQVLAMAVSGGQKPALFALCASSPEEITAVTLGQ